MYGALLVAMLAVWTCPAKLSSLPCANVPLAIGDTGLSTSTSLNPKAQTWQYDVLLDCMVCETRCLRLRSAGMLSASYCCSERTRARSRMQIAMPGCLREELRMLLRGENH